MMTMPSVTSSADPSLALRLAGYAASLLMVATATLVGLLIAPRWGSSAVVLLYLLPVLASAISFGLWPALTAAVASTLAYNYFFTEPYRTLVIHSPADAVTVLVLFVVAVVTSRMAASLRDQAQLVAAHAARNATIAGFARRLLSCASANDIAEVTVGELSTLFACQAMLLNADGSTIIARSHPHAVLAPSDYAAAAVAVDTRRPAGRGMKPAHLADWQFHPVCAASRVAAAVGLARDDGTMPVGDSELLLLSSLLDQVALALERARLELEARETATLREREQLRSALLQSIGLDVKPRLNAVAAAARALRRDDADAKDLAATIASEVTSVDRYIDNLVDLSPGIDPTPIELGPLTVDLYRRAVLRNGDEVHLTPKEYAVLAELTKHVGRVLSHSHLLRVVWGPAQAGNIDYLRVAIRALRQKLERDPAHPELIVNEPAVGYRLVCP